MQKLLKKFQSNLPLLLIVFVGLFIALQNTSIRGFYSGWDNIHAELNLGQYAYRVFYGAWKEHEGLGGPAAKAHLAEITRVPYLFLLQTIFPTYLVRAVFLFTMYLTGGTTMYFFIKNYWINAKKTQYAEWIAGFSALLYLLHPLTLQQFYISFELFTVQFAFFPLLLISIHKLAETVNKKTLLLFGFTQLALASSAHTPTVFYLGALISVLYAAVIHLQVHKKIHAAITFGLSIGLFTFLINGFWILPNLYYSFNNSEYVTESKANIAFGPEALWSIRESSNLHSFLTGYNYLTSWKDYNFQSKQHELIFNEWEKTFTNPFQNLQLYILASLTIIGALLGIIQGKKQPIKLLATFVFLSTSVLIWIDLFPTKNFIIQLYESKTFLEIFRNPFTKLSVLHSIFVVILASETLQTLINRIQNIVKKQLLQTLAPIVLSIVLVYTVSITYPSFQGKFISEKLHVIFPEEYQELYNFMQSKNKSARVLEMPYTSREGWVLYDWSNTKINGYQGLGFYFFGIPQPFMTSDFARWSGVNDYFYEELEFALNSQNSQQLTRIAKKYNIPYAILDETRVQPYNNHSFDQDKAILEAAGFKPIWNKNFLTVYESPEIAQNSDKFIIPNTVTFVSADTARVSTDTVLEKFSEYIQIDPTKDSMYSSTDALTNNSVLFPFSTLQKSEVTLLKNTKNQTMFTTQVKPGEYIVDIPPLADKSFKTTIAVRKIGLQLEVFFPQYSLLNGSEKIPLITLSNMIIPLEKDVQAVSLGDSELVFTNPEFVYVEVEIPFGQNMIIQDIENGEILAENNLDWETLAKPNKISLTVHEDISLITDFPEIKADLTKQPSENCVLPQRGTIQTTYSSTGEATYIADEYGVNCNSVTLPFLSTTHEYIVTATGENILGRSIKLFIHYAKENSTPIELILPEKKYSVSYPLRQLSQDKKNKVFLNWETRSFSQKSENRLDSLTVTPLPLQIFSKITLTPKNQQKVTNTNTIKTSNQKKHSISHYSLSAFCETTCYFGINQAFDDLWLAYDFNSRKILPHFRYNNWANLWQVETGEHKVVIIYVPQFIAFLFMGVAVVTLIVFSLNKKSNQKHRTIQTKIKNFITANK